MTDDQAMELGRRVVACAGFRWCAGMRALYPDDDGPRWTQRVVADDEGNGVLAPGPSAVPDLRDPGTVGGLLALVREAWGDPLWVTYTVYDPEAKAYRWAAHGRGGGLLTSNGAALANGTEAEALVWALFYAPEPAP